MSEFTLDDFRPMPSRLSNEKGNRIAQAAKAMQYHQTFLDDCLRAILPNDLVILGAETGFGKTDMSLNIAMANAMADRRVCYFALEAERLELERRVKFSWICTQAYRRNIERKGELNYTDWYLGRCEDIVGGLDAEADQWMLSKLCGMRTFYRGTHFDRGDLRKAVTFIEKHVEMVVIDHLHYIDADEQEDEHRALGDTTKTVRDVALQAGKPVLVVAHLRKKDARAKVLVPTVDDFHGSSNITKIATQVITIAPAAGAVDGVELKWWQSPTFVAVLKDRRAGAPPFVALTYFDKRTRRYDEEYTLGRLNRARTEWEPLKVGDRPQWALGHRQLEITEAA